MHKNFLFDLKKKIDFSPSFEHHKRVKSVCRLNHINWALELCNNSSKSALRLPNNIRFAEVQRFLFFFFFSHTLHRIIAGVSSQNAIVQQQQFASKWTHYFLITLFCLFKSPLIIYYSTIFLKLKLLLFHPVFYIKYRVSQQVLDRTSAEKLTKSRTWWKIFVKVCLHFT